MTIMDTIDHYGHASKPEIMSIIDLGSVTTPQIKPFLKQAALRGVNCAAILQNMGIPEAVIEDQNGRISGEALQELLATLIREAQDPYLGLHASIFVQPATYSVLGYIALNSTNLRELLDHIPRFERIVSDLGVTSIHIDQGLVLQRWDCRFQQEDVRRHLIENILGSWQYYSMNYLNFPPADCILLEHPAPRPSNEAADIYRQIFGCDVKFNQPASGVQFKEERLDFPVPEANEQLLGILLEHASSALQKIGQGQQISVQVRSLLQLTLRDGISSREQIASRLGISGRTLQRQLIAEGTHYQQLLNDLRQEMAIYHLKNTALEMESIAARLGYSEVRSFYRGFRQWTGQTPGEYRKQHC